MAVVLALINGSRLFIFMFIFMEGCLDIIYQVRPRGLFAQNLLALVMLLLFVVLFPVAVLASATPAQVVALLRRTAFSQVPGSNLLFGLTRAPTPSLSAWSKNKACSRATRCAP